jgi:monovalent cation:H+ antiporter, CPA1 family
MTLFELISLLVAMCAVFAYLNTRFLKLPPSVGLMVIALLFSVLVMIEGHVSARFHTYVEQTIRRIDFPHILIDIMLGFLLFAGSLHVNLSLLKKRAKAVTAFALLGTAISTFLFGAIICGIFHLFSVDVPLIYCILFGAVVSPTDPIAVLGILKKTNVPKDISIMIEGESLFNDGIGVVLFLTILEVIGTGLDKLSFWQIDLLFLREVAGGMLLGVALSYIIYFFIKKVSDYHTVVLISLALVMITGSIARLLHVSGPLAVIVIGLFSGTIISKSLNDQTRDYHNKFWELIDDFLNALLFVLIGLQMVLLPFLAKYIEIGAISIILLLLCRFISLRVPMIFLKDKSLYNTKTSAIMTWGGLRGGLSIALTLSLPENPYKEIFISITFMIVVFSVLVQALTTEALVKRLFPGREAGASTAEPRIQAH